MSPKKLAVQCEGKIGVQRTFSSILPPPTNVTAQKINHTSISVDWSMSEGHVVKGYKVYLGKKFNARR